MRKGVLAIGIILLFIGLALLPISRESITVDKSETQPVPPSPVNTIEISNVFLTQNDKFFLPFSGQTGYADGQDDILVYIDNPPPGNRTTMLYKATRNGVLANYTGYYKMGLIGVIPGQNFIFQVRKIIEKQETQYPNSYLLPAALALIAIGTCISIFGAKTSKRRIAPRRRKQK